VNKIEEMHDQRERISKAGAKCKFSSADEQTWFIEAVFVGNDGVGDLMTLTSVDEVDAFIGSFCPNCWRVDRRRRRGGLCSPCDRGMESARTTD